MLFLIMAKIMKTKKDEAEEAGAMAVVRVGEEEVEEEKERNYRETDRKKGQRKRGDQGSSRCCTEEVERGGGTRNLVVLDIGQQVSHLGHASQVLGVPHSLISSFRLQKQDTGSSSKVYPTVIH